MMKYSKYFIKLTLSEANLKMKPEGEKEKQNISITGKGDKKNGRGEKI